MLKQSSRQSFFPSAPEHSCLHLRRDHVRKNHPALMFVPNMTSLENSSGNQRVWKYLESTNVSQSSVQNEDKKARETQSAIQHRQQYPHHCTVLYLILNRGTFCLHINCVHLLGQPCSKMQSENNCLSTCFQHFQAQHWKQQTQIPIPPVLHIVLQFQRGQRNYTHENKMDTKKIPILLRSSCPCFCCI